MIRSRIALIIVACMLPVLVAFMYFGTTRIFVWMTQADGHIVNIGGEDVANDNGDFDLNILCNGVEAQGCYRWCGVCHANGEDKSKEVYTAARHEQRYFPVATMRLSEGQRVPWGAGGGQLMIHSGQLAYILKDGLVHLKAPAGSVVLKDRLGTPSFVLMPAKPTIQPIGR